jgi:hypothetical protein
VEGGRWHHRTPEAQLSSLGDVTSCRPSSGGSLSRAWAGRAAASFEIPGVLDGAVDDGRSPAALNLPTDLRNDGPGAGLRSRPPPSGSSWSWVNHEFGLFDEVLSEGEE